MKGLKLRLTLFASITLIALSIICKEAITLLTEYSYSDLMFFPVRALELLGIDLLIFCIFAFLVGRKIDDREFPSRLKDKGFAVYFLAAGAILASVDAVRDAVLQANASTAPASASVPSMFFLWLGIGSLLSLHEVEDKEKRMRAIRASLSIAASLIFLALYVFNWIYAMSLA